MKRIVFAVLVCFFSSGAAFANWEIDSDGSAHAIMTTNTKGSWLGVGCNDPSDCHIILALDATCEKGAEYPLLVNSISFTGYITATCSGRLKNKLYVSMLDNFDHLINSFRKDSLIGIAMPLNDGLFRSERFSLIGYKKAEQELIGLISKQDSAIF